MRLFGFAGCDTCPWSRDLVHWWVGQQARGKARTHDCHVSSSGARPGLRAARTGTRVLRHMKCDRAQMLPPFSRYHSRCCRYHILLLPSVLEQDWDAALRCCSGPAQRDEVHRARAEAAVAAGDMRTAAVHYAKVGRRKYARCCEAPLAVRYGSMPCGECRQDECRLPCQTPRIAWRWSHLRGTASHGCNSMCGVVVCDRCLTGGRPSRTPRSCWRQKETPPRCSCSCPPALPFWGQWRAWRRAAAAGRRRAAGCSTRAAVAAAAARRRRLRARTARNGRSVRWWRRGLPSCTWTPSTERCWRWVTCRNVTTRPAVGFCAARAWSAGAL